MTLIVTLGIKVDLSLPLERLTRGLDQIIAGVPSLKS